MFCTVVVMILIKCGESEEPQNRYPNHDEAGASRSTNSKNPTTNSHHCYEFYTAEESRKLSFSGVITNVSAESVTACKMYCWYHKSCSSFTFNSTTSNCSLYDHFPLQIMDSSSQGNHSSFDFLGNMDCLMNFEESPSVPCRIIKSATTTNKDSKGVLMKNVNSRLCLGFGKLMELNWKDCTSAIPWLFERRISGNDTRFKILQEDSLSYCLEADETHHSGGKVASLALCEDDNVNQLFEIIRGTIFQLSSVSDPTDSENHNNCFFKIKSMDRYVYPGTSNVWLGNLRLLFPEEHLALCRRNKLKVANGNVEGRVPLYLPGSNISVRCKSGYGFKEFAFQSTLNITCQNEKTRGLKCVKHNARSGEASSLKTILVFGNVGQAVIIMLLVVLVIVLVKKIRALTAGHNADVAT